MKRRVLSHEERVLWRLVAQTVKPLPGRGMIPPEDRAATTNAPENPPGSPNGSLKAPIKTPDAPTKASATPTQKPLAPIEQRLLRQVRRGHRAVDGSIDLHGLRQAEALERLRYFLLRKQLEGATLVIVVTGKGVSDSHDGRGVLRRQVPHWLRLPDMRPIVLGFEEAAPHQGGAGALYVRLRRPESARNRLK